MKNGGEEDSPLNKMEIALKVKEEKVKDLEVSIESHSRLGCHIVCRGDPR